jgi:hypothetical protein
VAGESSDSESKGNRLRAWAAGLTWQGWTDKWVHRITLVVIVAVTAYMIAAVRAPHVELDPNPGFAQVLVNNRAVVLAIWIIAIDGAIFLLASLIARTAAKQWARQAGGVGTGDNPADEPKDDVKGLAKQALDLYGETRREIEELTSRLTTTERDHSATVRELEVAERDLAECRDKLRERETG